MGTGSFIEEVKGDKKKGRKGDREKGNGSIRQSLKIFSSILLITSYID
jgi:hypothetical protein